MSAVEVTSKNQARPRWWVTDPYAFKLWRTDLKTVIASVLWGIVVTLVLQVTERLDAAIFGGSLFLFELFLTPSLVGPVLFGLPGGWVTTIISPIFANLLATHPLAPFFFINNSFYTVIGAFMTRVVKRPNQGITFWRMLLIGYVASIPGASMFTFIVFPHVLDMPQALALKTGVIQFAMMGGLVPISFICVKRLLTSKLWP